MAASTVDALRCGAAHAAVEMQLLDMPHELLLHMVAMLAPRHAAQLRACCSSARALIDAAFLPGDTLRLAHLRWGALRAEKSTVLAALGARTSPIGLVGRLTRRGLELLGGLQCRGGR